MHVCSSRSCKPCGAIKQSFINYEDTSIILALLKFRTKPPWEDSTPADKVSTLGYLGQPGMKPCTW